MIYIHTLKDLNPKSAEIESVPLVREIKKANSLPLSEEKMMAQFSVFFVLNTDLDAMSNAVELIPAAIDDITRLSKTEGDFELINLHRAYSGLKEILEPLKNSLAYSREIFGWQELFVREMTALLNGIRSLRTQDEKKEHDRKISSVFEKVLRNKDEFLFNFGDVVNEAQLERITALAKSMNEGFFFHVKLEEHLKKQGLNIILQRFSPEQIENVNAITQKIMVIKKGIERAYEANMRMVNLAVTLYSYIKWLR